MARAIDGIRFVDGGGSRYSFCCDPQNTIVIALNPDSMLLNSDEWILSSGRHGLMDVVLLYAHEARHNLGFHHTCVGRPGDDNTLAERGAWTIEYDLALWIAKYGERAFLQAPGPDRYCQAALEAAAMTKATRFCEDPPSGPGPTLSP
jgi:hypothetical protein